MSPFVEKISRRVLFCTASLFMGLSMAFLSTGVPSADAMPDDDLGEAVGGHEGLAYVKQLMMPVAVILFSLSYGAGFGPSIYTWSSELFPPR